MIHTATAQVLKRILTAGLQAYGVIGNLILSRESRQYEIPGQAQQDTGNDFDIAPVN